MREQTPTLTPTLSLSEGEGDVSIPSPPKGERDRVRGRLTVLAVDRRARAYYQPYVQSIRSGRWST